MKRLIFFMFLGILYSCGNSHATEEAKTDAHSTNLDKEKGGNDNPVDEIETIGDAFKELKGELGKLSQELEGLESLTGKKGDPNASGISLNDQMFSDEQLEQMGISREDFKAFLEEQSETKGGKGGASILKNIFGAAQKGNLEQLIAEEKQLISNIRTALKTSANSFVEEDLRRKKGLSLKLKNARDQIVAANGSEAREIIQDYYGISNEEFDLLKLLSPTKNILSESEAKNRCQIKSPTSIQDYLKTDRASMKFNNLAQKHHNLLDNNCQLFLKKSALARKSFYQKNPGWYGEDLEVGDTYMDSRNEFIYLPLGELSFADEIIDYNPRKDGSHPKGLIGPPNMPSVEMLGEDPRFCNIGTKGSITIRFLDNALVNVNGPDLYVFEMGKIEPTNLEISRDGQEWIDIGKIQGGTAKVDIAPFVAEGETFTYVRLTDLETWSEIPGADIDAVASIGGAIRLNLDSSVLFETGKSKLKESAKNELTALLKKIQDYPSAIIKVEGHTDNVGDETSNFALSEKRAESVSSYLQAKLDSKNYSYAMQGFGESRPLVANDSKENRQLNRRVEVLVIPQGVR